MAKLAIELPNFPIFFCHVDRGTSWPFPIVMRQPAGAEQIQSPLIDIVDWSGSHRTRGHANYESAETIAQKTRVCLYADSFPKLIQPSLAWNESLWGGLSHPCLAENDSCRLAKEHRTSPIISLGPVSVAS